MKLFIAVISVVLLGIWGCSSSEPLNVPDSKTPAPVPAIEYPQGQICQSCSMPMTKPADFGTNADKSRNNDYCCFCYQGGNFIVPNMTMQEMIDLIVSMAGKMNMTEAQAKQMAESVIPHLKRWQIR